MENHSLAGKVAVITGASSGIGRAIAEKLSEQGVRCVITGRRGDRLRELAGRIDAWPVVGDVLDPGLPRLLLTEALDHFGACHFAVNNAGVMETASIAQADIERFCRMVRINVEGAYRFAYTFLKHFVPQGDGYLINISSILGTKVRPGTGAYAGTKYALEALTESLRMELAGSGVGVTAIEPALTLTELHNHWEQHPMHAQGIQEPLQAGDIADAVVYVLSRPAHVRIPRMLIMPQEQSL